MALKGLEEVLKNINQAITELNGASVKGLIRAGALIRREGQKQTPVDTSNLVNSWYGPEVGESAKGPLITIGLTALYAPYVHEMVGANFKGPRPGAVSPARQAGGKPTAKAKFLEDPLKENEARIIEIISEDVKIK
jgi:hypothetical protein